MISDTPTTIVVATATICDHTPLLFILFLCHLSCIDTRIRSVAPSSMPAGSNGR